MSALLERTSSAVAELDFERLTAGLVPHSFASRDDAEAAARTLGTRYGPVVSQDVLDVSDGHAWLGLAEGRTFRLAVSPGTIGLRTLDATRAERATERQRTDPRASVLALYDDAAGALASIDAPHLGPDGLYRAGEVDQGFPEPRPARVIAYWSGRSRARMFTTVPQLDLSEWTADTGSLAMVTLTLPGDWQAVAPTGRHFKRAIERFRSRLDRAGLDVRCLWKLEFQGRGAPHWHALMRVPALVAGQTYEAWLSTAWAECVGADDTHCHRCDSAGCNCEVPDTEYRRHLAAGTTVKLSGEQYSDPRRITTYFLGHSSKHSDGKEYQHIVPSEWRADGAGPGRFWGYWGLKKGTVEVDLDQREWYAVRRMLRHVHRARAWRLDQAAQRRAAYWARQGEAPVPRKRYRLRNLGAAGTTSLGGGVVVVNDGIGLAYDIGRALAVMRS